MFQQMLTKSYEEIHVAIARMLFLEKEAKISLSAQCINNVVSIRTVIKHRNILTNVVRDFLTAAEK